MTSAAVETADHSLQSALEYQNLEIVARFKLEHPKHAHLAEALFTETKKWLWLNARSVKLGGPKLIITPETRPIDEMWHTFILFTREYEKFCKEYLRLFIHHDPATQADLEAFKELRQRSEAEAKLVRQNQIRPQLEFIQTHLGEETLKLWYIELPKKWDI